MPMNASTSGSSRGSSSRNRCGKHPETMSAWPRFCASRTCADSRMASTLSSWAASMNEQVLTMTASARAASLTISAPSFSSEPSMISASARFLAQPSEIRPMRKGRRVVGPFVTGWRSYANSAAQRNDGKCRGSRSELLPRLHGREGQRVARLFWLIESGAEIAQRVFGVVSAPDAIAEDHHQQRQRNAEGRQRHAPVDLGQLQHDHVEKTVGFIGERRRVVEFFRLTELCLERGHQRRHIELHEGAVGADKPPDIHRRGEDGVVPFLERADVVGLDLGDVGDLINGEALGLARRAELFGHCEHDRPCIAVLPADGNQGKGKESRWAQGAQNLELEKQTMSAVSLKH